MKRINLENGDFITVDEKANKPKKRKKTKQAGDGEIELSAIENAIIFGLGVFVGAACLYAFKNHTSDEKETKQITDKTDPTAV